MFSDNKIKGIQLCYSSNYNEITKCAFSDNGYGVIIGYSEDVTESSCQENRIHWNNFLNNNNQAYDKWSNEWYNNYWSDYSGEDYNDDELGDTSYNISGGSKDDYPFVEPLSLVLPEEEKPVGKFVVQPTIIIILIVIIIISIVAGGITFKRKRRKQKEEHLQEHIPEEVKPLMVACPYCQTSFHITPTKKPFKAKCPNCGKISLLR